MQIFLEIRNLKEISDDNESRIKHVVVCPSRLAVVKSEW